MTFETFFNTWLLSGQATPDEVRIISNSIKLDRKINQKALDFLPKFTYTINELNKHIAWHEGFSRLQLNNAIVRWLDKCSKKESGSYTLDWIKICCDYKFYDTLDFWVSNERKNDHILAQYTAFTFGKLKIGCRCNCDEKGRWQNNKIAIYHTELKKDIANNLELVYFDGKKVFVFHGSKDTIKIFNQDGSVTIQKCKRAIPAVSIKCRWGPYFKDIPLGPDGFVTE